MAESVVLAFLLVLAAGCGWFLASRHQRRRRSHVSRDYFRGLNYLSTSSLTRRSRFFSIWLSSILTLLKPIWRWAVYFAGAARLIGPSVSTNISSADQAWTNSSVREHSESLAKTTCRPVCLTGPS